MPATPGVPRAEALNDALAVSALLCGLFFWPLGLVFGHLSNQAARAAGRKNSPLAVTGLVLGYAWLNLLGIALIAVTFHPPIGALIIPPAITYCAWQITRHQHSGRKDS